MNFTAQLVWSESESILLDPPCNSVIVKKNHKVPYER